jgi:hypothetical protein
MESPMSRRNNKPAQAFVAIALNLCVIAVVGVIFANSFAPLIA